jgi:hypothetical protein
MSQDLIAYNTTHENADFGHSKSNMEIENLKNKDLNALGFNQRDCPVPADPYSSLS